MSKPRRKYPYKTINTGRPGKRGRVSHEIIIDAVEQATGMSHALICSPSYEKSIIRAKWILYYLLHKNGGWSYRKMAEYYGGWHDAFARKVQKLLCLIDDNLQVHEPEVKKMVDEALLIIKIQKPNGPHKPITRQPGVIAQSQVPDEQKDVQQEGRGDNI